MYSLGIINLKPTSNQPANIVTSANSSETINWILYDEYWGLGQYRVWVNDTNDNYYIWKDWTPWVNETPLNVPINRSKPGIYNYTIQFKDNDSEFGLPHMVIVTILDFLPTSNQPKDIQTPLFAK